MTLADASANAGLRLALEVIPNALATPDALIGWLTGDLELGDAGVCLDIGHAHILGAKDPLLHRLAPTLISEMGEAFPELKRAEPVIKARDPKGEPIYWVGPAGGGQDAGEGTDFHAVASGHASVTPIKVDLTDHRRIEPLSHWLAKHR